jgi:tetraacyldisaccharide 4'-kinase
MKIFKPKFWSKKNNLISFFLFPFSLFFQLLIILKNSITKKEKFSLKVICIGNIYLGGTGKTPLSLAVVEILKKLNKNAAIIKKNYKKHEDEFKLIESKQVTLFINSSRALAIKEAVINKFDCVVLDDGFQDSSINKNLNIICFNEKQLIGNGMTLPSGPLREPFSSLKKCQIVVINGNTNNEFEKKIKNISNYISIYYSNYLPTNIEQFKDQNLLAFAGTGNPENFFNLLEKNGLKIIKKISFPDHYNYSLNELNELINFSLNNNLKLITTEKDFFRIKHYKLTQIQYLEVKLEIENKACFEKEIIQYL